MKNVPNILSAFRLLLVPVFVWVFFADYPNQVMYAMIIFLLAGFTDVVDGYLARKFKCTSMLGKILDPVADKLMQITAIVCLYIADIAPLWLLMIVILKEGALLISSIVVMRTKNVVVVSNWLGKLAVCVFYFGVCYFIVGSYYSIIGTVDVIVIAGIMGVVTVAAFAVYLYKYSRKLKSVKKTKFDRATLIDVKEVK